MWFLYLQAVLSETRSQQAASMTEFNWLGRRFPITSAKTRVAILKGIRINFMSVFSNYYGLHLHDAILSSQI
jgi:hypothetical protein